MKTMGSSFVPSATSLPPCWTTSVPSEALSPTMVVPGSIVTVLPFGTVTMPESRQRVSRVSVIVSSAPSSVCS